MAGRAPAKDEKMLRLASADFSRADVLTLAGISCRQLEHWIKRDLLRPAVAGTNGRGTVWAYSFRDIVACRTVKRLMAGGMKLGDLVAVADKLRAGIDGGDDSAPHPFVGRMLVTDGRDVYTNSGQLWGALSKQCAARALWSVDLDSEAQAVIDHSVFGPKPLFFFFVVCCSIKVGVRVPGPRPVVPGRPDVKKKVA